MFDEQLATGDELYRQLAGRSDLPSSFGASFAQPNLSDARISSSVSALLEKVSQGLPEGQQIEFDENLFSNMATRSLERLREPESAHALSLYDRVVVEAVVEADGSRPVLDITPTGLDFSNITLGDWEGQLTNLSAILEKAARSVGAVRLPNQDNLLVGTGFAVGDHLIMTNKHVLQMQHLAQRDNTTASGWVLTKPVNINFAQERDATLPHEFIITDVVYMSPDAPAGSSLAKRRDICLLRCAEADDFPEALQVFSDQTLYEKQRNICAIGFPTRPALWSSNTVPPAGYETIHVITSIFRDRFGFKRLAVGEIEEKPGFFSDDQTGKIFAHDASTLRGNSGACVLDINTHGDRVMGLHFGGFARDKNFAHALANFQQELAGFGIAFV